MKDIINPNYSLHNQNCATQTTDELLATLEEGNMLPGQAPLHIVYVFYLDKDTEVPYG